MPPRDWRERLEDILEAIDRIQSYTEGMDKSSFDEDQKTIKVEQDLPLPSNSTIGRMA